MLTRDLALTLIYLLSFTSLSLAAVVTLLFLRMRVISKRCSGVVAAFNEEANLHGRNLHAKLYYRDLLIRWIDLFDAYQKLIENKDGMAQLQWIQRRDLIKNQEQALRKDTVFE